MCYPVTHLTTELQGYPYGQVSSPLVSSQAVRLQLEKQPQEKSGVFSTMCDCLYLKLSVAHCLSNKQEASTTVPTL